MQSENYYRKQTIFVDLRAQGRTLHRIGEILGIRPSTLARWERHCARSIADAKSFLAPKEPDDEEQLNRALTHPCRRLECERAGLRAWLEFEYRFRMVEIIAICFVRANAAGTESHMQALALLQPGVNRRHLREMSPTDFAKRVAQLTRFPVETPGHTSPPPASRNRSTPVVANN